MKLLDFIEKLLSNHNYPVVTKQQESVCSKNMQILLEEQGFLNSLLANECVDKGGRPIPWYTYPAIEYIAQFDLREKLVFEYGSGNSSLFWAERSGKVISVENDLKWYEAVLKKATKKLELSFQANKDDYVHYIDKFKTKFDVIVVDGAYRFESTEKALSKIAENGLIILDNSDRAVAFEEYSKATRLLRDAGLIQVDMSGFGPLNNYTWTTSFFFTKGFNFRTKDGIQPQKPVGGNISPSKGFK